MESTLPWRSLIFIVIIMSMTTSQADDYNGGSQSQNWNQLQQWTPAHATFYGDDSAQSTMGGACGYGNFYSTSLGTNTAALSSVLFLEGSGCGQCYEIRCDGTVKWCYRGTPSVIITATNLCPPNWAEPSDNGGWCNPPRIHFDMAKPAFEQIADWKAGIVPVMYRRVPCPVSGGVQFLLQGNAYWLLVFVINVGGPGDIAQMWVKGGQTDWIAMTHNWGASYQAMSSLGGQCLSFKIQSFTTQTTIILNEVAPAGWTTGCTYQGSSNFQ